MASDTSRWNETIHGLRSVSTVIPPTTACAGMPRRQQHREPAQVAA